MIKSMLGSLVLITYFADFSCLVTCSRSLLKSYVLYIKSATGDYQSSGYLRRYRGRTRKLDGQVVYLRVSMHLASFASTWLMLFPKSGNSCARFLGLVLDPLTCQGPTFPLPL